MSYRWGRLHCTREPEMRPEFPRPTRAAKPDGYAFCPVPMDAIYLDYNGSVPLDPRVAEVMASAMTEGLGNASAIHPSDAARRPRPTRPASRWPPWWAAGHPA